MNTPKNEFDVDPLNTIRRWLNAGATISRVEGVQDCLYEGEDGVVVGNINIVFPAAGTD